MLPAPPVATAYPEPPPEPPEPPVEPLPRPPPAEVIVVNPEPEIEDELP